MATTKPTSVASCCAGLARATIIRTSIRFCLVQVGELWFSQGLHIRSHVETPWGIVRLEQAGIWRLWPRRLKLEGFYGSEHEPQNPWGFVFTDWAEPIVLAGNNSSAIYPVPGLVLNHRHDPPALIWKNGNGRKV